jgi:hypothetical protein
MQFGMRTLFGLSVSNGLIRHIERQLDLVT